MEDFESFPCTLYLLASYLAFSFYANETGGVPGYVSVCCNKCAVLASYCACAKFVSLVGVSTLWIDNVQLLAKFLKPNNLKH